MTNLIIVGTIGLDDVETPFGKVKSSLGGSGSYASLAASFFCRPGLVSVAGSDLPDKHWQLFSKNKIDTAGVEKTGKTFRWSGKYLFDMNEVKTKKTELNSLANFDPTLPPHFREAKFLFLGNIDPTIQLQVLKQMKGKPFAAIDTMDYWIELKKEKLLRVISKIQLVVMNESEARMLFDTPNLIKAGRELLNLGPDYAVIKKGEHGALFFSHNAFFSAPSYPLEEVKDPTGAGDSFAGGLMGYLTITGDTSEKNIRKGIVYGSIIASFCAEGFSLNYLSSTKLKDIKERYNLIKKIRKF